MEIECQDFFFCGDGGFYLNIIKPEVNISLKELLNSFKGGGFFSCGYVVNKGNKYCENIGVEHY